MLDPPYKWGTVLQSGSHSHSITPVAELSDDAITRLLESKVTEFEKAVKADLDRAIFGASKPERNPLRQAIADACDQVTFDQALATTMSAYKSTLTDNIFREAPILRGLSTLTKEKTMMDNPTVQAVDDRRYKRARKRVKRVGNYFDSIEWEDGDIVRWQTTFDSNTRKTYHYVALKGGNRWYVTGDSNHYATDGLIGKIAEQATQGTVIFEDDEDKPL